MLSAAGLLIFPPAAALAERGLRPWAAALLGLGLLVGLRPSVGAAPAAILVVGPIVAVGLSLSGWVRFESPGVVARLLPFAAGGSPLRGELEYAATELATARTEVELPFSEAGLVVESLELRGPLALAALLSRPQARGARGAGAERFFRIAGLAGPAAARWAMEGREGLLASLADPGASSGFEPGSAPAERTALWGLLARRRAASPLARLEGLESTRYALDASLSPVIATD